MALRRVVVIALTTCIFVLTCDACDTEKCSTKVATASSHKHSSTAGTSKSKTHHKKKEVTRCPKNEEFSVCTQSNSRAQYCFQKGQSLCSHDDTKCTKGCICKENYLRNKNGICIPEKHCDTDCDQNEILEECPADCADDYCPTKNVEANACFKPEKDECPSPVCKCEFNHRRAKNGTCISTRDCPPFDCSARPNEEFNACPPLCPTDDCSQATPSGNCPPQFGNILITLPCNPKCRCIKGYWRKDGICVPYEECPNICPLNEEYNVCTQAICRHQNCNTRNDPVSCPDIDPAFCKKGCVCKENYCRNENGTCVPEEQCNDEPKPTCDDNEVLVDCPSDCASDHCPKSEADNKRCEKPNPCPPPACKCRFNHRRSENGTCIPTVDCPPFDCSAKPHQQFTPCPPLCPTDSCGLPRIRGKCPFRIGILLNCNPRCQCKDGFGRLKDGTCVPIDKCPNICPINEEYNYCTQAICRNQNCSTRNGPVSCPRIDPAFCKGGCVCKENYYRNENGTCVPEEHCNANICPINEEYNYCTRAICRNQNCSTRNGPVSCPRIDPAFCKGGCVCKENYYRNENGTCVPEEHCNANICPINEEYNYCTQAICRNQNCNTRNGPVSCPRIDPAFCKGGCVCKENHYRNENGICIPEEQCNEEPTPTCEDNEVLVDCPSDCASDYCPKSEEDNKRCDKPNPCPPPACKCRFNHRRALNGTCIPTVDCPPFACCAKANEQYTPCPPICPSDSCGLPRVRGRCPYRIGIVLECNPKCQCKDGYGRLENAGLCPTNEEYNSCTQAVCRPQNCSNKSEIFHCPMVEASSCKKDCVCKKNYYRNDKGVCVEDEKCAVRLCPNPNEEYKSSLVTKCPLLGTCTSIVERIKCDKPEAASCVCKNGYFRLNETSACKPICECPQMKNALQCQTDCS